MGGGTDALQNWLRVERKTCLLHLPPKSATPSPKLIMLAACLATIFNFRAVCLCIYIYLLNKTEWTVWWHFKQDVTPSWKAVTSFGEILVTNIMTGTKCKWFIVWLHEMRLELMCKTFWTVSKTGYLGTSSNTRRILGYKNTRRPNSTVIIALTLVILCCCCCYLGRCRKWLVLFLIR